MKILNEIVLSIYAYPKALRMIKKYNLIKYVVVLVLLLSVFVLPVVFIGETATFFSSFIPFLDGEKYARVGVGVLSSFSGVFLLLLLIPIFTLISDEVNYHIRGIKNAFSMQQFIADIIRGLKITLRNFIYQYVAIILVLLVFKVILPGSLFTLIGRIAIFIITSYFYGFSLMDYAMENHKMNYKASVKFTRSHVGLAIGLGLIYYSVIRINDVALVKDILGNLSNYWSTIAEAVVAFVGVIAANIVLNIIKK
jgi:CysZ protein